jgi:hypothetical protein
MSYTKEGWYYDGKGRTCTKCGEYKSWDESSALDYILKHEPDYIDE